MNNSVSDGKMPFESSVCFKFWKSLNKLELQPVGWRLAAYWRERGYDA